MNNNKICRFIWARLSDSTYALSSGVAWMTRKGIWLTGVVAAWADACEKRASL